jgi:hypothetical protein
MDDREELNQRFLELDSLPKKLSREDAQNRGHEFEELVQNLFSIEKILRKGSYHTSDGKSEQIDGALNIDGIRALLEVKWVSSGLAASALYSFIGKVEGKFVGTVGIFLSRVELSDNFLKSLRAGRRQCVIVIHGEDVDYLFKPTFPVKEYLTRIIDHLSYDNQFHLSAKEFLRKNRRARKKKIDIHPLIKKALELKDYTNIIYEWVDEIENKQAIQLAAKCIETYLNKTDTGAIGDIQKANLLCLFDEVTKNLPEKHVTTDWLFFDELSINFISSSLVDFLESFSSRFKYLTDEKIKIFGKRLSKQWHKIEGNYDSENKLAFITEFVWDSLDKSTKKSLTKLFITFIDSSRRSKFPQMQLANKILSNSSKRITHPIVKEILKENILYWFDDDRKQKRWKKKVPEWYCRQYSKWQHYLRAPIEDVVNEVIEELTKEKA